MNKTTPEIRKKIIKAWNEASGENWRKGGRNLKAIGDRFGVTGTTVRMIADPSFAERRRNYINANRRNRPPPSAQSEVRRERRKPSLAPIPGSRPISLAKIP